MKHTTAEKRMKKSIMPFGKYGGKSYSWVLNNDPDYSLWVIENVIGFQSVKNYFIANLKPKLITIDEALKNIHKPQNDEHYEIYEVIEHRDNEGFSTYCSISIHKCYEYIFTESKNKVEYMINHYNEPYYKLNNYIVSEVLSHYSIHGKFKTQE